MALEHYDDRSDRTASEVSGTGTRRSHYDIFGTLLLEVRGEGGRSTRQFRELLGNFEVEPPTRDPDVVVERTTEEVAVETVLGGPTEFYGWTGEEFVVRRGAEFMLVDPEWRRFRVSPNWEPYYATYPIEFHLRRRLVEEGQALVHASGVRYRGRTVLFPAWRGAGKTNTLFSMLAQGADFLADDRLWVGADGTARSYPLAVNLHPRNTRSFPQVEVQYDDVEGRLRSVADQRIQDRFGDGQSVVEKAVSFLSSRFIGERGRTFAEVRSLFPDAEYVEASPVDAVVLLDTDLSSDTVRVDPIGPEEMLSAVTAISHFEWDSRLEEYFRAYDALVPGGSVVADLEAVVDAEERVLRALFERVGTYRAGLPRAVNWRDAGVDRGVVDAVESIRYDEVETV